MCVAPVLWRKRHKSDGGGIPVKPLWHGERGRLFWVERVASRQWVKNHTDQNGKSIRLSSRDLLRRSALSRLALALGWV